MGQKGGHWPWGLAKAGSARSELLVGVSYRTGEKRKVSGLWGEQIQAPVWGLLKVNWGLQTHMGLESVRGVVRGLRKEWWQGLQSLGQWQECQGTRAPKGRGEGLKGPVPW